MAKNIHDAMESLSEAVSNLPDAIENEVDEQVQTVFASVLDVLDDIDHRKNVLDLPVTVDDVIESVRASIEKL